MSVRLSSSARRLAALALAMCGLVAFVLAIQTAPAGAVPLTGGPLPGEALLVPQIINGQESSISQFPWQVFVLVEEGVGKYGGCGGSILNATTILTAAHCVTEEGTETKYPEKQIFVIAGASLVDVQALLEIEEREEDSGYTYKPMEKEEEAFVSPLGPTGAQIFAGKTANVRVDPDYAAITTSNPIAKDDVAVITLSAPFQLSAARGTATISLVSAGATPAAGTALSISGYGEQSGKSGAKPNGKLYSTTLTAMSSSECEPYALSENAIYLCAESATSATCQGDSGGPLTEGSPAVQVGIVDSGLDECPLGKPTLFTNVAVPEIRDFIGSYESPPTSPPPSPPPPTKSAAPPTASIAALKCHLQTCRLSISASDPNALALTVTSSAAYEVTAKCPVKKGKKTKKGKQPVCHKTHTVNVPVSLVSPGVYSAVATKLPYGENIAFTALATDAAGLHSAPVSARSITLQKPPKPKKKTKSKKG